MQVPATACAPFCFGTPNAKACMVGLQEECFLVDGNKTGILLEGGEIHAFVVVSAGLLSEQSL